jgi:hypothetical protein
MILFGKPASTFPDHARNFVAAWSAVPARHVNIEQPQHRATSTSSNLNIETPNRRVRSA